MPKGSSNSSDSATQGRDRQPGKNPAASNQREPEPSQAASAADVQSRSNGANEKTNSQRAPDQLPPRSGDKKPQGKNIRKVAHSSSGE